MHHCANPRVFLSVLAMLLLSTVAHAQLFRAYVSSAGSDANPCTLPSPCRLLPAALAAVADGGEIWMLDSANYNSATVDVAKSVSILAIPGAVGSVVAVGGPAISIATGGVKVALRNLVIVPLPGSFGGDAISMTNGSRLHIEDCLIAGNFGEGVLVNAPAEVTITNSTIRNNGQHGVYLLNGARGTIARSTISGNTLYGISVVAAQTPTTTTADITDSTISSNPVGVEALSIIAGGVIKVSVRNSQIVRSATTGAIAQLFRAYVASNGNDANPCNLPAPCRLLPAALAAVADGGEIWMLDSANYNTATVTIGKSVSILAVPGAVGSVVAVGGPAISITAGGLTAALRNLVIVPLVGGAGTHGVSMTGASNLSIEDSLIANLPDHGVYVTGTGNVKITRTIIRNNGNWAVWLQNGSSATISGTQMLQNGNGAVFAFGTTATTTTAAVSDSVISGGSKVSMR